MLIYINGINGLFTLFKLVNLHIQGIELWINYALIGHISLTMVNYHKFFAENVSFIST